MNKKGDFPTILLVLIAFALSAIALFAFASFNGKFENQSQELSIMMSSIEFEQQYLEQLTKITTKEAIDSSAANPKQAFQKLIESKTPLSGTENFFGKVARGEFTFEQKDSPYIFQMQNVTINSEQNKNKIIRTLNICMRFDSKGEFLNNC